MSFPVHFHPVCVVCWGGPEAWAKLDPRPPCRDIQLSLPRKIITQGSVPLPCSCPSAPPLGLPIREHSCSSPPASLYHVQGSRLPWPLLLNSNATLVPLTQRTGSLLQRQTAWFAFGKLHGKVIRWVDSSLIPTEENFLFRFWKANPALTLNAAKNFLKSHEYVWHSMF